MKGVETMNTGIDQVLENADDDWLEDAREVLQTTASGSDSFTADDFRGLAEDLRIGEPHHHNSWSAVMAGAARSGSIIKTGKITTSRRPSSHARILRVWKRA